MMILSVGSRDFSFKSVGMCGSDVAMHGREAWFMMYSVAEGPSVSYNETEYSDWDMQARSVRFISERRTPFKSQPTSQLPFRPILAPQTHSVLLLSHPRLLVDLDDTNT